MRHKALSVRRHHLQVSSFYRTSAYAANITL
nr:MAG TPA: hypothetical protein [Caudoviricetes sp.]